MGHLLWVGACAAHGVADRMNAQTLKLKYATALKSIAIRYWMSAIRRGYQTDRAMAFLTVGNPASDRPAPDWRAFASIERNLP